MSSEKSFDQLLVDEVDSRPSFPPRSSSSVFVLGRAACRSAESRRRRPQQRPELLVAPDPEHPDQLEHRVDVVPDVLGGARPWSSSSVVRATSQASPAALATAPRGPWSPSSSISLPTLDADLVELLAGHSSSPGRRLLGVSSPLPSSSPLRPRCDRRFARRGPGPVSAATRSVGQASSHQGRAFVAPSTAGSRRDSSGGAPEAVSGPAGPPSRASGTRNVVDRSMPAGPQGGVVEDLSPAPAEALSGWCCRSAVVTGVDPIGVLLPAASSTKRANRTRTPCAGRSTWTERPAGRVGPARRPSPPGRRRRSDLPWSSSTKVRRWSCLPASRRWRPCSRRGGPQADDVRRTEARGPGLAPLAGELSRAVHRLAFVSSVLT